MKTIDDVRHVCEYPYVYIIYIHIDMYMCTRVFECSCLPRDMI